MMFNAAELFSISCAELHWRIHCFAILNYSAHRPPNDHSAVARFYNSAACFARNSFIPFFCVVFQVWACFYFKLVFATRRLEPYITWRIYSFYFYTDGSFDKNQTQYSTSVSLISGIISYIMVAWHPPLPTVKKYSENTKKKSTWKYIVKSPLPQKYTVKK